VKLEFDVNHDGVIDPSFTGPDNTDPYKPFVFWNNNDFDRGTNVDCVPLIGCDWEEDDLPIADSPGSPNIQTPDWDYKNALGQNAIPSMRDLEDYARLWISGISNLLPVLPTNYVMELRWRDFTNLSNPTLNIFQAVEQDGGTLYLSNEEVAAAQIGTTNASIYVGTVAPNQAIQLNDCFAGRCNPSEKYIFCGAKRGKGELLLRITSGETLVCETSVFIEIKDIKEMYERWTVGDDGAKEPASTAYLAAEDLPVGAPKFQYGPAIATNTPYVLLVHGWNMERWEKDRYAETTFKRLYWQGYQGRFGSFRWPTRSGFEWVSWQNPATAPAHFDQSEFNAWQAGVPLRQLLTSLNSAYPGRVFLAAHSMGNTVAGEALRLAGTNRIVATYIAMQAAVGSHAYDPSAPMRTISSLSDDDTPNRYAEYYTNGAGCYFATTSGTTNYINFYNAADYALASSRWGVDQDFKPDGTMGYHYDGTNFTWGTFDNPTILTFPTDTYKIFSFCVEARCFALGAQSNVGGVFQTANEVNLNANPYSFGSEHKFHSGQFRSTNMKRAVFWNRFLIRAGLKTE
jgi:hypothetical protein